MKNYKTTSNCAQSDGERKGQLTHEIKRSFLRNITILEGLPASTLQEIAESASMCQLKKRGVIYFPELQTQNIYFLCKGHVKIVRLSPEGQETILEIIGPGDIFGELCLVEDMEFNEDNYVEIAEALDEVQVLMVSCQKFLQILEHHPKLNIRIIRHVGLKLRKAEAKLESLVFKNAQQRVSEFICKFAEAFGKIKHRQVTVDKFLSQKEIAQLTGTSRQTVASILNNLRKKGIIDFTHQRLVILNLNWMQQYFL
ncbi:MAG: Crp/Fnr family transcriptional regulator [Calditrichaeota bacterium]|nr:MAG: Crp/Fnr family transcriptional regulator [Calditrichota bacterium]